MDDLLASIRRIIADEPATSEPDIEADEPSAPRPRRRNRPSRDPAPELVRRSIASALQDAADEQGAEEEGGAAAYAGEPGRAEAALSEDGHELSPVDRAFAETTRLRLADAIDRCNDVKHTIALPDRTFDGLDAEDDISIYRASRAHDAPPRAEELVPHWERAEVPWSDWEEVGGDDDSAEPAYETAEAGPFDPLMGEPDFYPQSGATHSGEDDGEAVDSETALAELLAAVDRDVAASADPAEARDAVPQGGSASHALVPLSVAGSVAASEAVPGEGPFAPDPADEFDEAATAEHEAATTDDDAALSLICDFDHQDHSSEDAVDILDDRPHASTPEPRSDPVAANMDLSALMEPELRDPAPHTPEVRLASPVLEASDVAPDSEDDTQSADAEVAPVQEELPRAAWTAGGVPDAWSGEPDVATGAEDETERWEAPDRPTAVSRVPLGTRPAEVSAVSRLVAPSSTSWMRQRGAAALDHRHERAVERQQQRAVEPRALPANDEGRGAPPAPAPAPQRATESGGRWRPGSVRAVFQDIAARNRKVFEGRSTPADKSAAPNAKPDETAHDPTPAAQRQRATAPEPAPDGRAEAAPTAPRPQAAGDATPAATAPTEARPQGDENLAAQHTPTAHQTPAPATAPSDASAEGPDTEPVTEALEGEAGRLPARSKVPSTEREPVLEAEHNVSAAFEDEVAPARSSTPATEREPAPEAEHPASAALEGEAAPARSSTPATEGEPAPDAEHPASAAPEGEADSARSSAPAALRQPIPEAEHAATGYAGEADLAPASRSASATKRKLDLETEQAVRAARDGEAAHAHPHARADLPESRREPGPEAQHTPMGVFAGEAAFASVRPSISAIKFPVPETEHAATAALEGEAAHVPVRATVAAPKREPSPEAEHPTMGVSEGEAVHAPVHGSVPVPKREPSSEAEHTTMGASEGEAAIAPLCHTASATKREPVPDAERAATANPQRRAGHAPVRPGAPRVQQQPVCNADQAASTAYEGEADLAPARSSAPVTEREPAPRAEDAASAATEGQAAQAPAGSSVRAAGREAAADAGHAATAGLEGEAGLNAARPGAAAAGRQAGLGAEHAAGTGRAVALLGAGPIAAAEREAAADADRVEAGHGAAEAAVDQASDTGADAVAPSVRREAGFGARPMRGAAAAEGAPHGSARRAAFATERGVALDVADRVAAAAEDAVALAVAEAVGASSQFGDGAAGETYGGRGADLGADAARWRIGSGREAAPTAARLAAHAAPTHIDRGARYQGAGHRETGFATRDEPARGSRRDQPHYDPDERDRFEPRGGADNAWQRRFQPTSMGRAEPAATMRTDATSRPFAAWHDRPSPPSPPPASRRTAESISDELTSSRTRNAASAAFDNLSRSFAAPSAGAPGAGSKAQTVDEIAREALRPLLREWMEANLTTIVERLVREEIERVVGRR